VLDFADTDGMLAATKEAIRKCLAAGFRRSDIAVISFRGREHSTLASLEQLGPHPLKSFTGRYDLLGQPVYTHGELLVESVYRFKGQAAPAVVLTEVDFERLDDLSVRKLFVGATRATMKLAIVASERAARLLRQRIDEAAAAPRRPMGPGRG
jgi:superfamily I DNA and RNA helicase